MALSVSSKIYVALGVVAILACLGCYKIGHYRGYALAQAEQVAADVRLATKTVASLVKTDLVYEPITQEINRVAVKPKCPMPPAMRYTFDRLRDKSKHQ